MVTRAQAQEGVFTPAVRTRLLALLREEVALSDVELLAYALMPNHLHLVVRQGDNPLHQFMQPLLRRAALLVQKRLRRKGHVFERRYRDHVCGDSHHTRNAVVYTHLNPVRAGLCDDPSEYPWTSRAAWQGAEVAADGGPYPVCVEPAMLIFATDPERSPAGLRDDYRSFEAWRRASDRILGDGRQSDAATAVLPKRPLHAAGDANWVRLLSPHQSGVGSPRLAQRAPLDRPDLSLIARGVLAECEGTLLEGQVRSRWGGRAYSDARHKIALRAAAAGYSGREIAAYLRITPGTVSVILTRRRRELLLGST